MYRILAVIKRLLFSVLFLQVSASALAQQPSMPIPGRIPTTSSAQKALHQAFVTHLRKVQEGDIEDQSARQIVFGDVDGDGVPDAVVQYTLESAAGNGWSQNLAVFLYKKGGYRVVANKVVGGKYFRVFTIMKLVGQIVIGQTLTYPGTSPQAVCDNPQKRQVKLLLKGTTLWEK